MTGMGNVAAPGKGSEHDVLGNERRSDAALTDTRHLAFTKNSTTFIWVKWLILIVKLPI